MCGITGRFNYRSGSPVPRELLSRMNDLIAHRGPDGSGVWTSADVGFGHLRLAVIDLSPAGRQPMLNADGSLCITFNGEIYNFLELRKELEGRGHQFRSNTDTEVILAAYREWALDCVQHLHGMFAFALWDAAERRLFIARDRAGKKPLHYWLDSDGVAFASEPKAFLADPGFSARPDLPALSSYLTLQYVPSPMSAFDGVRKLPPAHYLVVQDGRVSVTRYWKLSYARKRTIGEDEAAAELLDRLRDAVRARLISDVPLGAFLSGGVDSSGVVALMAELSPGPVKTFSIGFEESGFDELPYARLVARRYGTDHHEFVVRPDARTIVPKIVWHYNEPYADASGIPTFYLSELARAHVTVALNGDAGDENFAGYRRYVTAPAAARFRQLPGPVREAVHAMAGVVPVPARSESILYRGKRWLRRVADTPIGEYSRRMTMFDDDLKRELCDPQFLAAAGDQATTCLNDAFNSSDAEDWVDALLDVDVNCYLPDCLLVKVDIATMAFGLEGRSPMLDHRFMEFAASLPADLKLRGAETKYVLKRALRPLLPPEILDRPKHGFSVPIAAWLRTDLQEMSRDLLLDGRLAQRGYFRRGAVERLVDEHQRGAADWHTQLWTLLMFESWHRMFIDERSHLSSAAPAADGLTVLT